MSLAELEPDRKRVFVQKQRVNIYTMMLIVAFMAIVTGCLFLYLEMKQYEMKVKVPQDAKVPPPTAAASLYPGTAGSFV